MQPAPELQVEGTDPPARLRPLRRTDVKALHAMLQEPDVKRWWGEYDRDRVFREIIEDDTVVPWIVEAADGAFAGFVQAYEEDDSMYRHGGIDISVRASHSDRGLGTKVVRTVARWMIEERGHHRLIIDPAAANARAIAAYAKVGFRPVGIMRRYEQGPDGVWHDGLLMDLLAEELLD